MKKLFLLPLVAMFGLVGCGGNGGGGDPAGGSLTINKASTGILPPGEGESFYKDSLPFSVGGVAFTAKVIGIATKQSGDTKGYDDLNVLQLKKSEGVISSDAAVTYSSVTVNWYATYSTEASTYWPVVKLGDSVVPAKESGTLNGVEKTGYTNSGYQIYSYVSTFDLSGSGVLSIGAGAGALYFESIVIA